MRYPTQQQIAVAIQDYIRGDGAVHVLPDQVAPRRKALRVDSVYETFASVANAGGGQDTLNADERQAQAMVAAGLY